MAKSFAQSKGARGEREVVLLLQPIVDKVFSSHGVAPELIPRLQRNTLQSHLGGCDLTGLDWLALEVKRCETLNLNSWISQCIGQSKPHQEPVLIYKQNHGKWKVQMFGLLPIPGGSQNIRAWVEVSVESFLVYFEYRLVQELNK